MIPALTGKLELVYEGEQEGAGNVAKHIIGKAINKTFKGYFPDPQKRSDQEEQGEYQDILDWFAKGNTLDIPDLLSTQEYKDRLDDVTGLNQIVKKFAKDSSDDKYALMDLVIEALHQNSKLGKEDADVTRTYSDMLGSMLGGMTGFDDEDFDEG
jgi:magnesium chelatase subunit I